LGNTIINPFLLVQDAMQQNIEDELKELKNKARFISCLISGEIKIV
jgi:hypothetical protein